MALARRLSDRLTTCLSRRFLVEWRTAVMSVGGFLGLAHNHYPIPWSALKYDTALQGYRTGVTEGQLKALRNSATISGPIEIGKRASISTMEHPLTGELDQFRVPRKKRWRNECHLSKSDTDGRRAHSHAYLWMQRYSSNRSRQLDRTMQGAIGQIHVPGRQRVFVGRKR